MFPGGACYQSTNDLSGLSVAKLDVAGSDGYQISGGGITLREGGLAVDAPTGAGNPPAFDLPLTLAVPQSWMIGAGPVLLRSAVSGGEPLTVNFDSGSVEPQSGMEVGAITGNGVGGFYLDGNQSLNSSDENPIAVVHGAGIEADQTGNSSGPVMVYPGGYLSVGGVADGGGQLGVNGELSFVNSYGSPGNTVSGGQELDLAVDAPGTTPGVDYSQVTATGDITLKETTLNVYQGVSPNGSCDDLRPGDVLALLSTSGGTISGTFSNYGNGAAVDISDDCNGADTDATGTLNYSSTAVTLTIVAGGDAGDVPVELSQPSLSGPSEEGQTLQINAGSWQGQSSLQYSWWQCLSSGCSQIPDAAGSSLTLTSAQLGYAIVAGVAAVGPDGVNTDYTAASAVVSGEPVPASTLPPAISGSTVVGDVLTATTGSWSNSPSDYTFDWERCSSTAGCQGVGEDTSSYKLTDFDVGSVIAVRVAASNYGGESAWATSAYTTAVSLVTPPATTVTTPRNILPTTFGLTPPTATAQTTLPRFGAGMPSSLTRAAVRSALGWTLKPEGSRATAKAVLRLHGYRYSFPAPAPGRLTVVWTAKRATVTLGHASLRIATSRTVSFKLGLTAQGMADLRRYAGLAIKVRSTFKAPGMRLVTATARFRLAGRRGASRRVSGVAVRLRSVAPRLGFSGATRTRA